MARYVSRWRLTAGWVATFLSLPFWMLFGAVDGAYNWLSALREIAAVWFQPKAGKP